MACPRISTPKDFVIAGATKLTPGNGYPAAGNLQRGALGGVWVTPWVAARPGWVGPTGTGLQMIPFNKVN
jgi:hypothetical protein